MSIKRIRVGEMIIVYKDGKVINSWPIKEDTSKRKRRRY